jgi:predicted DNA-binding transcriptional regulator AlpA
MAKKKNPNRPTASKRTGTKKHRFAIFEETRHFITITEAAHDFGVSRQTLYRWMAWEVNPFPKPIKLNEGIVRLSVAAIRYFVENCEEATILEAMNADDAQDSPGAA